MHSDTLSTNARVLTTPEEIHHAFFASPTSKTPIWIFNSNPSFNDHFPKEYAAWLTQLQTCAHEILFILTNESLTQETLTPSNAKVRYLSSQFTFPSNIVIYEDTVFLVMQGKTPLVILLKDDLLANKYRHYFSILWEAAKTKQQLEYTKNKKKQ